MKDEILERVEELLSGLSEEKEEEINDLKTKIEKLEDELDFSHWKWMIHGEVEDEGIPVPRLELRYEDDSYAGAWSSWKVHYSLVYRHLLGHLVKVPLGLTRVNGGSGPMWDNGNIDLPFRDGAHIKNDGETLNLPMFAVVEPSGDIEEKVFKKLRRGYKCFVQEDLVVEIEE